MHSIKIMTATEWQGAMKTYLKILSCASDFLSSAYSNRAEARLTGALGGLGTKPRINGSYRELTAVSGTFFLISNAGFEVSNEIQSSSRIGAVRCWKSVSQFYTCKGSDGIGRHRKVLDGIGRLKKFRGGCVA